MSHWWALTIRPQREFVARDLLTRDGYEVFLPTEHRWHRISRHRKRRVEFTAFPLIPGYLFVLAAHLTKFDGAFRWSFVVDILGFPTEQYPEGVPHPISPKCIEKLREISHEGKTRPATPIGWRPEAGNLVMFRHDHFLMGGRTVKVGQTLGRRAKRFLTFIDGRDVIVNAEDVELVG